MPYVCWRNFCAAGYGIAGREQNLERVTRECELMMILVGEGDERRAL